MAQDEQVLVVERAVLDAVGMFQGLLFDVGRHFEALFAPGALRFVPRSQAEADPSYKQLIPYVVMSCAGRVLSYVRGRRSGEARLVGCRSIGIGGHINPVDEMPLFDADMQATYRTAVQREVAEEVVVEAGYTDRLVALLNDDSTEVGQVHLGVVHHWALDKPAVSKREQMITRVVFLSVDALQGLRDEMETWSQLCVDHVDEITASKGDGDSVGQMLQGEKE
jgi:predicted NUDIX family phosphoesterase